MSRPVQQARIVLASASPRRQELLRQVGIPFVVDPSAVSEEPEPGWSPAETAERLSERKAEEVARRHPDADLVIGSDTVVVLEGRMLGKPEHEQDAVHMLKSLSGRTHEVMTGYALLGHDDRVSGVSVAEVRFRELDEEEIRRYVLTGEPMDKAGSYAIQGFGGLFVEEIHGDYPTIVGLPLARINRALRHFGWRVI